MDNYAKTILEDRSRVLLLLTGNEGDYLTGEVVEVIEKGGPESPVRVGMRVCRKIGRPRAWREDLFTSRSEGASDRTDGPQWARLRAMLEELRKADGSTGDNASA
jgi:hypothetical protein